MATGWHRGVLEPIGAARPHREPAPQAPPQTIKERFAHLPETSQPRTDLLGWTPSLEDLRAISDAASAYYGIRATGQTEITMLEITKTIADNTPMDGREVDQHMLATTLNGVMEYLEGVDL